MRAKQAPSRSSHRATHNQLRFSRTIPLPDHMSSVQICHHCERHTKKTSSSRWPLSLTFSNSSATSPPAAISLQPAVPQVKAAGNLAASECARLGSDSSSAPGFFFSACFSIRRAASPIRATRPAESISARTGLRGLAVDHRISGKRVAEQWWLMMLRHEQDDSARRSLGS